MPVVEVGLLEVALVEPGEVAEVLDDLLDPLQALAGAVEQAVEVVQGVAQVDSVGELADPGGQLGACSRERPSSASW